MPKIRIYNKSFNKEKEFFLDSSQSHYLVNVMRKKVGDRIIIFNEEFGEFVCELISIKKNVKVKTVLKKRKSMDFINHDIWLCFGIVKTKTMKYLVEKTSEIGIRKYIPIITQYSENIKININRMKKISIEAIEQSNSLYLPTFENPINLPELLKKWDSNREIILCDESVKYQGILDLLLKKKIKKGAFFVGPVGGWSDYDRKYFEKLKKVNHVSLGSSLLKVDTASIFALSCYRAFWEFKNE